MSSDELRRMKAQQDNLAAQLHRTQLQLQAQQARKAPDDEFEEEEEGTYTPNYIQAQPDEAIVNSIAQKAAQQAAYNVQQNLNAQNQVQENVKTRMKRLVDEYPAIQDENSQLTVRARDAYARITTENPTLDEASKYELAVREAASRLGARPVNAPVEDYAMDYTMPTGRSAASSSPRASKNRLTENIVKNAMAMGINVDPNSAEGKKNLAELNEYSARFNADADEQAFKYR